jgi:predicted short-subunit dehydrogenase-like oxidoreductase (DUF2520 family)
MRAARFSLCFLPPLCGVGCISFNHASIGQQFNTMRATINVIGPGRLGCTLARLWRDAQLVRVEGVFARDRTHADEAITFVGAGRYESFETLRSTDFTLLAVPDDAIAGVAQTLAATGCVRPGDVVFHCSGALSSGVLAPLAREGALLASVHPLKSFADPAIAIKDFAGTYCACEGDAQALARLAPLFDAIGARRFDVDPASKTLYHAGAVLACNDLVALMEAALRCMEAAGVERNVAWPALRPLIAGTLENMDRLSTQGALTGPVARGDAETVARQMAATGALDPHVADVYRSLGHFALQLARLDPQGRAEILASLGGAP